MWEILLTLLILLLSILWWMASNQPCSTVTDEEERVKFLLTLLVESRWSGLTYKLLYRHRHHRGLTSADDPSAADRAAAASGVAPTALTSPAVDRQVVRRRRTPPSNVQPVEQPEIPPTIILDPGASTSMAAIPLCPQCNQLMRMKHNRRNGGLFWGCMAYPVCKGTRRPGDPGDGQK